MQLSRRSHALYRSRSTAAIIDLRLRTHTEVETNAAEDADARERRRTERVSLTWNSSLRRWATLKRQESWRRRRFV